MSDTRKLIDEIMEKLATPDHVLPCPFCGGHYQNISFDNEVEREIWCRTCGASISRDWGIGHKNVVAAWNRRTKINEKNFTSDNTESVPCSYKKIHNTFKKLGSNYCKQCGIKL